jgi:hypothetical protein
VEGEPRRRAGIGFVAALDSGPLVARHGPGPAVGEQVDQDVVGMEVEQVPAGGLEGSIPLVDGRQADGLDRVDSERLDDRPPAVHAWRIARPTSHDFGY